MLRRLSVVTLLTLAVCDWALAADRSSNVTIMTQNMDDGTDLSFIVAASMPNPPLTVADAVDLTYGELVATKFEQRNAELAKQIALRKPDILALQEASLWRTGTTPDNPTIPIVDEIASLMAALNAAGVPYDLGAVYTGSDLALPGNHVPVLRLTDRNALLTRSDLRRPDFHLSDIHSHVYSAAFPFGPFQIHAGWISAMVHTGNEHFRLFTTHLQSPIPGIDAATQVQMAQARELIHELRNLTDPVVICGDFNSDAAHNHFLDDTATADLIQSAGYAEVWPLMHPTSDPGLTWPLYLEDQVPPPSYFAPFGPKERIDLFFERGMQRISIDRVVTVMPSLATPPYGSDHAGVIAVFRP